MNQPKGQFSNQLDELIHLFKTLQQKAVTNGQYKEDAQLFESFEQLVKQYESMRNMVPAEFINEMGEPIKAIIEDMIVQLRADLGINKEAITKPDTLLQINEIDVKLKSEKLSSQELDALLDERTKLQKLL